MAWVIHKSAAIMHVGEAGLEYVDEYDEVRFINFEACGENAAAFFDTPSARSCVARQVIQIDAAGQIAHTLEFFTRPLTVFTCESDRQQQALKFRIEQMGWRIR
ncbi:MAG: hypothetical protein K8J31_17695 [Anaerolineae bacterium]|nr:hypothetical protein [Anaerolineae bacterium]